jgi:hypothetical protein
MLISFRWNGAKNCVSMPLRRRTSADDVTDILQGFFSNNRARSYNWRKRKMGQNKTAQ